MPAKENLTVTPSVPRGRLLYGSGMVAMATLFGYILTYRFDSGYSSRFGISQQLVDVTLVSVLGCVGSLLFAFYFVVAVVNWVLTREVIVRHRIGLGLIVRLCWNSFILLLFCALVTTTARGVFPFLYAAALIGLVVIEIVVPMRSHSEEKGWLIKIDAYRKAEREKLRASSAINTLERIFGYEMILVFAFGMLLCWPAPIIGGMSATGQRHFTVAAIDEKPYVLIRRYGDQYLFESLKRTASGNLLCARVLTMTAGELAAKRVLMQSVTMEPPRMTLSCE